MKSYVVGGAVRDRLLGRPVSDRDHVVVGATVDEMLAAGFKPVGRDFPVFLHPETHEEYALARTERKVAPGYSGFVFHADPSVSLEADLARRDLTINAMAEEETSGRIVDPHGGRRDLDLKVFRHIGPAFAEDPVRVLRIARFAARFADFDIAPETLELMRGMAATGEIDALVPERVWQELARGLLAARPSRMLDVLREADALPRLLPEIADRLTAGGPTAVALDRAAASGYGVEVRLAILLHTMTGGIEALAARLAIPGTARDVAVIVARERDGLVAPMVADPAERAIAAMTRGDAFRRPDRYRLVIDAIGATIDDDRQRATFDDVQRRVLDAALAIDAGAIARASSSDPQAIAGRLLTARIIAARAAAPVTPTS